MAVPPAILNPLSPGLGGTPNHTVRAPNTPSVLTGNPANRSKAQYGSGLTVKGKPMNKVQQDCANTIIGIGQGLKAPGVAIVACLFDSIYESSMGTDLGPNSAGYGGILGGATSVFGQVTSSAVPMATFWYKGGNGFQAGGGIKAATKYTNVAVLGSQVTAAIPFDSQGISTQYESQGWPIAKGVAEAQAIAKAGSNGLIQVAGKGTSANLHAGPTTPFYVGDVSNPNEDVWTAINRLAQDRQWYIFSDGEVLYLADGADLMSQSPVVTLDRWRDADRILHLDFCWDNTAFQYTATHKRKGRTQRKSTLAKVTSPVEANLQLICDIDQVRGGDTIMLSGCGPGDGLWMVGDCIRSVFKIYSDITLVPGIQALTEAEAEGGATGQTNQFQKGTPVAAPGGGNVLTKGALKGMANPLQKIQGLTPKRVDMGVDYAGSGTLVAIADGKIGSTSNSGWPGGAFIELAITSGKFAGKHWYYAENITPLVSSGQLVKAGDPIGTLHDASPNSEMGWSTGDGGTTLAASLNQQFPGSDPGDWTSAAGASANRLLVALGAPSGVLQAGGVHGTNPPGYP